MNKRFCLISVILWTISLYIAPEVSGVPVTLSENDILGIVRAVEQANDPSFPNYSPTEEICQAKCTEGMEDMEGTLEQCAIDLCGLPEDHISRRKSSITNIDFDNVDEQKLNTLYEEFQTDIQPSIVKTMEERKKNGELLLENTKQKIARLNNLEQNGPPPPPDPQTLDDLNSIKDKWENALNNSTMQIRRSLNRCKAQFVTDSLLYDKVKDFKENKNQYIEQFMNNVFSEYSQLSRSRFNDYVEQIEFDFPEEPKTFIQKKLEGKEVVESYELPFINVCHFFRMFQISDKVSYFTSENKQQPTVSISFFSCQFHEEYGESIFSHELAHVLSFLMASFRLSGESQMKYDIELRRCVQNRYTDDETTSSRYPGDKRQTEEGMADLISYFTSPGNITYCALLETKRVRNNEPIQYKDLTVFDNSKKHPPTFLRVLMEAIHKGKKLSPACKQVIEMNKDKINFEPCVEIKKNNTNRSDGGASGYGGAIKNDLNTPMPSVQ